MWYLLVVSVGDGPVFSVVCFCVVLPGFPRTGPRFGSGGLELRKRPEESVIFSVVSRLGCL